MIYIKSYCFLLALTGLLLFTETTEAQEITVINEVNDEVNLTADLKRSLRSGGGVKEQILISWYHSLGYFTAFLSEIRGDTVVVSEGCRYDLETVYVKNDVLSYSEISVNTSYSNELMQYRIALILDELESEGYLFSKVTIEDLNPVQEECKVYAELSVDEGERYQSAGILFPGASDNEEEYLKKISGSRMGKLITSDYLNDLRGNLLSSELFTDVGIPQVYPENGKAVIVIPVAERSLNQFDGLLGYVPDSRGNGQLVGDFELSLWNVLTQGNGLDLKFERLRPETTRLSMGVTQDWIGDLPVGAGLHFDFFQNDTTYQNRDFSLSSYFLAGRGLKITSLLGQSVSASGENVQRTIEPEGNKRYALLGFRFSSLDNPDVPFSGIRLEAGLGVANKDLSNDSSAAFSQQYISAAMQGYMPLSGKSVLALRVNGFYLNADKVTDSDLYRFGGARSLRGFAEEQFSASRVIWGDVEYRYLLDRNSYLFLFGAAGNYYRPRLLSESNTDFRTADTLISTGFGLSYKVRIGRLKFTYAISPEESLGNGKVHVGIVTRL